MGFYAYKNNMHNIILGEERGGAWVRVNFEQYLRLDRKGYMVKAGTHPEEEKRRKEEEVRWQEYCDKTERVFRVVPLVLSMTAFMFMIMVFIK